MLCPRDERGLNGGDILAAVWQKIGLAVVELAAIVGIAGLSGSRSDLRAGRRSMRFESAWNNQATTAAGQRYLRVATQIVQGSDPPSQWIWKSGQVVGHELAEVGARPELLVIGIAAARPDIEILAAGDIGQAEVRLVGNAQDQRAIGDPGQLAQRAGGIGLMLEHLEAAGDIELARSEGNLEDAGDVTNSAVGFICRARSTEAGLKSKPVSLTSGTRCGDRGRRRSPRRSRHRETMSAVSSAIFSSRALCEIGRSACAGSGWHGCA